MEGKFCRECELEIEEEDLVTHIEENHIGISRSESIRISCGEASCPLNLSFSNTNLRILIRHCAKTGHHPTTIEMDWEQFMNVEKLRIIELVKFGVRIENDLAPISQDPIQNAPQVDFQNAYPTPRRSLTRRSRALGSPENSDPGERLVKDEPDINERPRSSSTTPRKRSASEVEQFNGDTRNLSVSMSGYGSESHPNPDYSMSSTKRPLAEFRSRTYPFGDESMSYYPTDQSSDTSRYTEPAGTIRKSKNEKGFTNRRHRQISKNAIHYTEEDYKNLSKCTLCAFAVPTRGGNRWTRIAQHVFIHQPSLAPFKCKECGYKCYVISRLRSHKMVHHPSLSPDIVKEFEDIQTTETVTKFRALLHRAYPQEPWDERLPPGSTLSGIKF